MIDVGGRDTGSPGNNRLRNHMLHDRPHHLAQGRITYLLRRASGDLFLGPYGAVERAGIARFAARTHASASTMPR